MAGVDTEQLATGTRFGSYVIVRRLGRGSYGSVYEALRQPLNRRVALKLLHRQMATQEQTVARFIREAELVASLEHPHIVGVFDVGTHDDVPFLAMEFLEGQSLGDKLKHNVALPVAETVDLLLPIFSAVATVHDRGIVHRDLKPDNLLLAQTVTGEVTPKLLDFGIAKVSGSDNSLTRTNALMGTPFYMSPEQAKESKHIDARTDQWALGVIVWQCVAGRRPFRGNSLLDVLSAVAHGPIDPLRLIVPETPPAFERAVLGALQRDPALRYPTVWDFGWQLLPFASPMTQMKWREHFRERLSEVPDPPGASSVSLELSDAGFSATDRSVPPSMSVPPSAPSLPPPSARATPSPESSASFPAGLASASVAAPSRPTLPRAPSPTDSVGTLEPRALTLPAAAPPRRSRTPLLVATGVTALVAAAAIGAFALRSPAPQAATVAATPAAVPAPTRVVDPPAAPATPTIRPAARPVLPAVVVAPAPAVVAPAAPNVAVLPAAPAPTTTAPTERAPSTARAPSRAATAVRETPTRSRSTRVATPVPVAPQLVYPASPPVAPARPPSTNTGARRGDDIL